MVRRSPSLDQGRLARVREVRKWPDPSRRADSTGAQVTGKWPKGGFPRQFRRDWPAWRSVNQQARRPRRDRYRSSWSCCTSRVTAIFEMPAGRWASPSAKPAVSSRVMRQQPSSSGSSKKPSSSLAPIPRMMLVRRPLRFPWPVPNRLNKHCGGYPPSTLPPNSSVAAGSSSSRNLPLQPSELAGSCLSVIRCSGTGRHRRHHRR